MGRKWLNWGKIAIMRQQVNEIYYQQITQIYQIFLLSSAISAYSAVNYL
jgi:hypothetical protein